MDQRISFARSRDGTGIAYALSGDGPPLVRTCTWLTHLQHDWDSPIWAHWFRFMSEGHTLVRFDPRGCGLSQRDIAGLRFEDWVDDLEAVVDALKLERFPLFGMSQGAAISVAYALRHPDRISRLVLYAPFIRGWHLVSSETATRWRNIEQLVDDDWGEKSLAFPSMIAHLFVPEAKPEHIHWYSDMQKKSVNSDVLRMMMKVLGTTDMWAGLSELTVPTTVIQVARDLCIPPERVKQAAMLIPGCDFASIDSNNHILLEHEPGWEQFRKLFTRIIPATRPAAGARPHDRSSLDGLSRRERQILEQVARGLSNREISDQLFISEKTVRNHITSIFAKLDLQSRAQAIVLGRDLDL